MNVSLSGFNISWDEPGGAANFIFKTTELAALGSASIKIGNLDDETNYTFVVEAHYENGGISRPPANISVQTGISPPRMALAFSPIETGFIVGVFSHSDLSAFSSLRFTYIASELGLSASFNIPSSFFRQGIWFTLNTHPLFYGYGHTIRIRGILSDGSNQDVEIDFAWEENEEDHENGGILPGVNTDRDGRADSVDTDDDNDGVEDGFEARGCAQRADCDMDGTTDSADVDMDGDGLIEIATAEELDAVRYALDGSGRQLSMDGMLNTSGCGGRSDISTCNGYELIADIDLADYIENTYGAEGWQPLGHDTSSVADRCDGDAFSGIFGGNGFVISNLSINRPSQSCVGLFGHIEDGSEIRNLTLQAERVVGHDRVGGLVGDGERARIISSSVVAGEVSGVARTGGAGGNVGGLLGYGYLARIISSSFVGNVSGADLGTIGGLVGDGERARIVSSSVVAGKVVSESGRVGGLVGDGEGAEIFFSSVVVDKMVKGLSNTGGLVGRGDSANIFSSSVVVGKVSGLSGRTIGRIGGLLGRGSGARIYSSLVVVGEVRGSYSVGGLVGETSGSDIAYSYVVLGSRSMVNDVLASRGITIASYWDSDTSGIRTGNFAKTSDELREPTNYTSIYTTWDNEMDLFGDGMNEPLAVWCDRDNSGSIEADERTDANRIWDFGTEMEYPAIRCTPIGPAEWRSGWFLNGTNELELNQTRLAAAIIGSHKGDNDNGSITDTGDGIDGEGDNDNGSITDDGNGIDGEGDNDNGSITDDYVQESTHACIP